MNNFTTLQNNQASTKILLARIEPARYVNSGLTLTSGTTYTMTFPYDISQVQETSVPLTKVTGIPTVGQYSYNETTKLLTVTLNAVISDTNPITVYYYIFYTTDRVRTIGRDPEIPGADLRDWEPRLKGSPSFEQDIRNILDGIMSISSSALSLINNESEFEQYCSDNDSFYNKAVEIWHVLDGIDNIKKLFKGFITSLSVNRSSVRLSVKDNLSLLTNPALMGDTVTYYTSSHFTKVEPSKEGLPIPYFFGTASRHQLASESITGLPNAQKLNHVAQPIAVCTNYSTDIATTNNREYHLGRVGSGGIQSFGFTPSNVDQTSPDFTRLDGTASEISHILIGDNFQVSGSGLYECRVFYIDRSLNYIYITKHAGIILTDIINDNSAPGITIKQDNVVYYPMYGRDYTSSLVPLVGGNSIIKVTFFDNFEPGIGMTALDPQVSEVRYRIKPESANQLHGTIVNEMLIKAGISVNASTITAANLAFAVNGNFSIPYFDQNDFSNYTKYLEELLQSVIGYIHLDNDFTISYDLFTAPSSSTETTDIDIIQETYGFSFDYNDIVTNIICFNPHHNSSEVNAKTSVTVNSEKAKVLHGVNVTTRFRHVLEDYTTKASELLNVRSERFARYEYVSKQQNYISEIGDDVLLKKNGIPGQDPSRAVKILGLNKSVNQTTVTATDLLDL